MKHALIIYLHDLKVEASFHLLLIQYDVMQSHRFIWFTIINLHNLKQTYESKKKKERNYVVLDGAQA